MRHPDRIFALCMELAAHWQYRCPDWRFAQLMVNFIAWLGHDPFYMEDEDFLKKFREFMDALEEV